MVFLDSYFIVMQALCTNFIIYICIQCAYFNIIINFDINNFVPTSHFSKKNGIFIWNRLISLIKKLDLFYLFVCNGQASLTHLSFLSQFETDFILDTDKLVCFTLTINYRISDRLSDSLDSSSMFFSSWFYLIFLNSENRRKRDGNSQP